MLWSVLAFPEIKHRQPPSFDNNGHRQINTVSEPMLKRRCSHDGGRDIQGHARVLAPTGRLLATMLPASCGRAVATAAYVVPEQADDMLSFTVRQLPLPAQPNASAGEGSGTQAISVDTGVPTDTIRLHRQTRLALHAWTWQSMGPHMARASCTNI